MKKVWYVYSDKNKSNVTEESDCFSHNHIDYSFFDFYSNDILKNETFIVPDKIVFYLDNETYAMTHILKGIKRLANLIELKSISFEFIGKNKILIETYKKIINNISDKKVA